MSVLAALPLLASLLSYSSEIQGHEPRSFEFVYSAALREVPAGARRVEIWIPYPQSDENQEIEALTIEAGMAISRTRDPEYGNTILYLRADEPSGSDIEVSISFRVRRREDLQRDFATAPARQVDPPAPFWLEADLRVPLDERIRSLAAEVTEGATDPSEKIRRIYDYVVSTMTYEKKGTGWGKGDIYYACDYQRGNCTDFHALFIGLSRAVGVPTRFEIGFPLPPERGAGEISGYHCWARFFHEGFGWVPIDASEANKNPEKREYFFGAHDENRVLFTVGRDIGLLPRQQGEPLNFFIYPYVEIDGKKFEKIDTKFTFKDLLVEEVASDSHAASRSRADKPQRYVPTGGR